MGGARRRSPKSSTPQTLADALAGMYGRTAHGIKLGLEPVTALLEHMGAPHCRYPAIHIAGTNGKGSVAAMIESVLRTAGLRTGLYTSPHLVSFNERMKVDGREVTDDELVGLLNRVNASESELVQGGGMRELTFFELTTAMAFEHFAREKVDIAVLETGLGGRLDATNVVKPVLSVITTIGLDHAGFLGNTLRDVAVEKAGIIKPGRPVVCGVEDEEARSAIAEVARSRGSEVRFVSDAVSVRVLERSWRGQRLKVETEAGGYPPFTLPLPGSHQVANCATALLALETLGQVAGLDLDPETVRRGMESVQWAGRLQVLNEKPLTVLDCAHNPCGARALRKSLELLAGDRRLVLVTNFSDDKDARGILRELKPLAERAWVGTFDHPRLMRPGDVLEAMAGAGLEAAEAALPEALEQARAFAESHGCIVCIMGSVYLAGAVLAPANRSHGAAGQIS